MRLRVSGAPGRIVTLSAAKGLPSRAGGTASSRSPPDRERSPSTGIAIYSGNANKVGLTLQAIARHPSIGLLPDAGKAGQGLDATCFSEKTMRTN